MEQFEAKESSNVGWARYYPERGELEVDFKKDGVKVSTYVYDGAALGSKDAKGPGFPKDLWDGFLAAESKGRYFAYVIRPKFRGVKK